MAKILWQVVIAKPLIWLIGCLDSILTKVLGYSITNGSDREVERSLLDFHHSAHRMKVLVNGYLVTPMPVKLKDYLLRHVSYEDPVEAIAKDPTVSLVNIEDGKLAIFVKVGCHVHKSFLLTDLLCVLN